jgi:uncharacterized protein (TIRG00374 family)
MTERRGATLLKNAAGYVIAAAGLAWVFHDVHWSELLRNMGALNWWWVPPGIIADILSYVCQGYRWHLLLKPLGDVTTMRSTQAVYSGLFINELLPMHIGEVARAYLVSRWISKDIVAVIPSMAMERLFEGIWLAAGVGLTAIFVDLPRSLVLAVDIFGLVVLALTGIVILLIFRKSWNLQEIAAGEKVRWKPARWLVRVLGRLQGGLRDIGLSRYSLGAFFVSLFMFVFQALAFWFIMKAYGLDYSVWVGAAVFLIVHFGTSLPNTPGNIGTYQLFCVLGLTLFGVDKTTAAGFSVVVFILLSLPLWVLGFVALGQSGMTLGAIRNKVMNLRAVREHEV